MPHHSTCSIAQCDSPVLARHLCNKHYQRLPRPLPPLRHPADPLLFWQHVEITDTCWIWRGALHSHGYGILSGALYAHRVAFTLMRGTIPHRAEVCHTCDNPPCVSPMHLFIGSHRDNMRDAASKLRMHIKPGAANVRAILTWGQVREIRERFVRYSPTDGRNALALEFGVSRGCIADIVAGRRWPHLLQPVDADVVKDPL